MKKYKNFGLLVLALLFALPAAAQLGEERHNFAVGINGGLNMSSVSFNPKKTFTPRFNASLPNARCAMKGISR